MTVSQNGWPAIELSSDHRLTELDFITGKVSVSVRQIFEYFCQRFNAEVEPIVESNSYGWNYRLVVGGSSLSNHASGTAIDLNAPHHPLGKSGTFTPVQVDILMAILRNINSEDAVIRWGGSYAGRKDEMHFEIVGNAEQVESAVKRLTNKTTTSIVKLAGDMKLIRDSSNGSIAEIGEISVGEFSGNDSLGLAAAIALWGTPVDMKHDLYVTALQRAQGRQDKIKAL